MSQYLQRLPATMPDTLESIELVVVGVPANESKVLEVFITFSSSTFVDSFASSHVMM